MPEDDNLPSLKDFEKRLEATRKRTAPPDPHEGNAGRGISGSLAQAMRVGMEMFAALLVGGAIGWFLDDWWGTRPWVMLVCLIFGFSAGIQNAYRVSRRLMKDPGAFDNPDETN